MTSTFDKNLTDISTRYAKALLDIAQEKNELDRVVEDLNTFNEMYTSSKDLQTVLTLPTVTYDEKQSILKEIAKSLNGTMVRDFLYLLAKENRFNIFPTFYYCFQQELNSQKGIVEVEVKSVVELDGIQKQNLEKKLEEKLGKSVNINYTTTPEIIGGLVISYEGKIVDLSLNTKIKNLQKQLN